MENHIVFWQFNGCVKFMTKNRRGSNPMLSKSVDETITEIKTQLGIDENWTIEIL